jgi:hypothetical protein
VSGWRAEARPTAREAGILASVQIWTWG